MKDQVTKLMGRFFNEGFLIVDVETTGVSSRDEVIELGILHSSGEIAYERRFAPVSAKISPKAKAVHGIDIADLIGLEPMQRAWPEIAMMMRGRRVFAFNSPFDMRMIRQSCGGNPAPICHWHCAMKAAAQYLGYQKKVKLSVACEALGVAYREDAHNALADCWMTLNVLAAISVGK